MPLTTSSTKPPNGSDTWTMSGSKLAMKASRISTGGRAAPIVGRIQGAGQGLGACHTRICACGNSPSNKVADWLDRVRVQVAQREDDLVLASLANDRLGERQACSGRSRGIDSHLVLPADLEQFARVLVHGSEIALGLQHLVDVLSSGRQIGDVMRWCTASICDSIEPSIGCEGAGHALQDRHPASQCRVASKAAPTTIGPIKPIDDLLVPRRLLRHVCLFARARLPSPAAVRRGADIRHDFVALMAASSASAPAARASARAARSRASPLKHERTRRTNSVRMLQSRRQFRVLVGHVEPVQPVGVDEGVAGAGEDAFPLVDAGVPSSSAALPPTTTIHGRQASQSLPRRTWRSKPSTSTLRKCTG